MRPTAGAWAFADARAHGDWRDWSAWSAWCAWSAWSRCPPHDESADVRVLLAERSEVAPGLTMHDGAPVACDFLGDRVRGHERARVRAEELGLVPGRGGAELERLLAATALHHRGETPQVVAAGRPQRVEEAACVHLSRPGLVSQSGAGDQHGSQILEVERAPDHLDALLLPKRAGFTEPGGDEVEGRHLVPLRGEVDRVPSGSRAHVEHVRRPAALVDHPLLDPPCEKGRLGWYAVRVRTLVEVLPEPHSSTGRSEPGLHPSYGRRVKVVVERGVGDTPAGTVGELEDLLGACRRGNLAALEHHRADRYQRRPVQPPAQRGGEVKIVSDVEAPEDIDPAAPAVRQWHPDLEVGAGHPHDFPAQRSHGADSRGGLANDVKRVRVLAQEREVGVRVVADHVAVANRPQQAVVRQESVQPALLGEVVKDPLERVHDLHTGRAVGVGEVALQPTALVHCQRVAVGIDDADSSRGFPETDGLAVEDLQRGVVAQLDVSGAVEVSPKNLRPAHRLALAVGPSVVGHAERPHPLTVEEDIDRASQRGWDVETLGCDVDVACHPTSLNRSERAYRANAASNLSTRCGQPWHAARNAHPTLAGGHRCQRTTRSPPTTTSRPRCVRPSTASRATTAASSTRRSRRPRRTAPRYAAPARRCTAARPAAEVPDLPRGIEPAG